jgi:hypothetical protein
MQILLILFMAAFFSFCRNPQKDAPPERDFVHPGMLQNKADLDFLKRQVKSGAQPQTSLWAALVASPKASLDWTPRPRKVIVVGFYSKPDIGASDFRRDGDAAYTLALRYYVSGRKPYAEKAISILNAWSYTLDSVTDKNKKLLLGIAGVKFLNAGEIIRYTYSGWSPKDQQAFKNMILHIWYPLLKDFMPGYNGNWDAAISQTMMCIGIFCDRHDIFARAYEHLLKGQTNGAINHYFNLWGQCQESGRDQGHVQMGLGFLSTACEIAWKQGYDLYSAYSGRLAKGYEYTSKYMLGGHVKYVRYTSFSGELLFGDSISAKGRGKFAPVYERAYHHYHDRMGMTMPYTRLALMKSRPEGDSNLFMPWASLLTEGFPVNKPLKARSLKN